MMFRRELQATTAQNGYVEFHALPGSELSQSQLESELLPIVFAADPSLDDHTGRLLPGARAENVRTRLLVLGAGQQGLHCLGGIVCAAEQAEQVARLASEAGYIVAGNV